RAGADLERGRDLELRQAPGKQLRRPPLLAGPGAQAAALVGALLLRSGPAAAPRLSSVGLARGGSGPRAGGPGGRPTKLRAGERPANLRRRQPVPVPVRPAGGEAPG